MPPFSPGWRPLVRQVLLVPQMCLVRAVFLVPLVFLVPRVGPSRVRAR